MFRTTGSRRGFVFGIEAKAALAWARGDASRAATLAGAAARLRQAIGGSMPSFEREHHEQMLAEVRAALGAVFDQAWTEGESMPTEAAVELALRGA